METRTSGAEGGPGKRARRNPRTAPRPDPYLITGMGCQWLAQRRDDGQTLTAGGPEELRTLIIEDYTARPVAVPEAGS